MTTSALRVACNFARKLAVNDQRNLKAMVKQFELLPHIISGMSKKIKKFPGKFDLGPGIKPAIPNPFVCDFQYDFIKSVKIYLQFEK
jgi:hypothetical protein